MKGRVILIDMPKERASQAALLVDGRLEDLLLDPPEGRRIPAPGRIYWAKVDRLVPKMGGAFVKLTSKQSGFLREAKGLKEGQGVIVQVSSYAEPGKATPVTPRVLYKGRRLIHTPGAPGINVSRRIRDPEQRSRHIEVIGRALAEWESEGKALEGAGFIVRSAAEGAPEQELAAELALLLGERASVEARVKQGADEGRLTFAVSLIPALREWSFPDPIEIAATKSPHRFLATLGDDLGPVNLWGSQSLHDRLRRFDGPDLFDHYGVWDEIERLKSPRADLPSGAWMAVEATRAMVTVDVNTAGEFGGGAALTANLEAARELPRQLRLRGFGGQVIIDFAPLRKSDRKRIEEALKTAFRRDPIETSLAGWTPLGNFELQRKRERRPLTELLA
ncbi:MAG: ribonuclease E/G [Limibaculum sp.]